MAEIYDGKKLKAMRKRLGLTQAKLAKLAGVTQALISSVEHDVAEMAAQDTRARIANHLIVMEHERIVEMGATRNEKIESLKGDVRRFRYQLEWTRKLAEKLMTEKAALLEILNLKTKAAITEKEAEERIDALNLEKGPSVEEEALHAEIEQHAKSRVRKEKE